MRGFHSGFDVNVAAVKIDFDLLQRAQHAFGLANKAPQQQRSQQPVPQQQRSQQPAKGGGKRRQDSQGGGHHQGSHQGGGHYGKKQRWQY